VVRPPPVAVHKAAAEPPSHPLRRVVARRALPEPARRGLPRLLDGRRVRGARVAEARHLRAELGRRGAGPATVTPRPRRWPRGRATTDLCVRRRPLRPLLAAKARSGSRAAVLSECCKDSL